MYCQFCSKTFSLVYLLFPTFRETLQAGFLDVFNQFSGQFSVYFQGTGGLMNHCKDAKSYCAHPSLGAQMRAACPVMILQGAGCRIPMQPFSCTGHMWSLSQDIKWKIPYMCFRSRCSSSSQTHEHPSTDGVPITGSCQDATWGAKLQKACPKTCKVNACSQLPS